MDSCQNSGNPLCKQGLRSTHCISSNMDPRNMTTSLFRLTLKYNNYVKSCTPEMRSPHYWYQGLVAGLQGQVAISSAIYRCSSSSFLTIFLLKKAVLLTLHTDVFFIHFFSSCLGPKPQFLIFSSYFLIFRS